MANSEQDWPADPGSTEHAGSPAAPSGEDSTGSARPSRARSVWADMLIPGPDDAGETGPDDGTQPPAYGSRHEGTLGWPSSGLPPSFGQRPAAGERPDFDDPVPPPQEPSYGRHRTPPPQPGPAHPGQPEPGAAEPRPAEPRPAEPGPADAGPAGHDPAEYGPAGYGPAGYGFAEPPAPDVPQPRGRDSPEAAFGPWETYEAEAGHGWSAGYGAAGGQAQAPSAGRSGPEDYGGYGYVPLDDAAPGGEYESPVGYERDRKSVV